MNIQKSLALLEKHIPSIANLFKRWFVEYFVPMNRSLGIKIKSIDASETVLSLKRKRKNLNYGGTVHGAAIMALAETVHGVTVLWKFPPVNHLMVSKKSSLTFLKKARGNLEVRFHLSTEKEKYIEKQLSENGVCEVELTSAVTDKSGDIVAELLAVYHIKRRNNN
ncbi:MAG: DUF4442 domain-containing protein [Chloroflexi bacterium]|nr:DUF4442 domain-containing protein [Chloroflexota bacterium]